jgi:diketogulonate reductase-like aldo/keto reductase
MRFLIAIIPALALAAFPQAVPMSNAANSGMLYPVMGLGTAGGSTDKGFGEYPECWASCVDGECLQPDPDGGCGEYTIAAIATWFQLGGRRIDSANGYRNQNAVGRAIRESAVPRSDIFFQTKVGPYLAMGYNETLSQAAVILNVTGLTYIDNLVSCYRVFCALIQ